jgi:hypothetical protein
MFNIAASQERGWIAKFPEAQVAGKWRWSLLGPVPQTIEEDTGAGVVFSVDETIESNTGEYTVSVQRLDTTGALMGDSQSSSPFVIQAGDPPVMVDVEIAGLVSVTITKV